MCIWSLDQHLGHYVKEGGLKRRKAETRNIPDGTPVSTVCIVQTNGVK